MADSLSENKRKMLAGGVYHSFTPELIEERKRCAAACSRFNRAHEPTRRQQVALWQDIIHDPTPLPLADSDPETDSSLLSSFPWVESPMRADYGYNVRVGLHSYVNHGSVFVDTTPITIGARTLLGPNCSFFSGSHPLDPIIRNGIMGPESGKGIIVGDDCWLGGNVIVLPGVTVGRGSVVGAGSVVTKDVPPFHVVAGNPARIIRKIKTEMDPEQRDHKKPGVIETGEIEGPEVAMADMARKDEERAAGN